MRRLSMMDVKVTADRMGLRCLETVYKNNYTKMAWECNNGHVIEKTFDSIRSGYGCKKCYDLRRGDRNRLSLSDIQMSARELGLECLSTVYVNNRSMMIFQCQKGHVFERSANAIRNGQGGCVTCLGHKKMTMEDVMETAAERGFVCMEGEYANSGTPMRWRCGRGHEWIASFNRIRNGHGCRKCSNETRAERQRSGISKMDIIARRMGGECISIAYRNDATKLWWRCADGHEWEAVPTHVKHDHWCPICWIKTSTSRGEKACRKIFERIFNREFPGCSPEWLVNRDTGRKLKFDGYCEELGIAFEYNGRQHYEPVEIFNKTRPFENQQKADEYKRALCKQYNVSLVEIPYYIELNEMVGYIVKALSKEGVAVTSVPLGTYDLYIYAKV